MICAQIGDWQIPARLAGGLARYILGRVRIGGFLRAILENDLFEAVVCGDEVSLAYIPNLVWIIYNYAPAGCRGDHVDEWLRVDRNDPEIELEDALILQRYGKYWEGWIDA